MHQSFATEDFLPDSGQLQVPHANLPPLSILDAAPSERPRDDLVSEADPDELEMWIGIWERSSEGGEG